MIVYVIGNIWINVNNIFIILNLFCFYIVLLLKILITEVRVPIVSKYYICKIIHRDGILGEQGRTSASDKFGFASAPLLYVLLKNQSKILILSILQNRFFYFLHWLHGVLFFFFCIRYDNTLLFGISSISLEYTIILYY